VLLGKWRAGEARKTLRAATKLTDAELDAVLGSAEFGAALERMWRVVLREASLGFVGSVVARAEKESGVAKLMADLCGMTPTAGTAEPAADPEADFTAFERAILDNLRATLAQGVGGESGAR